jgi:endogenous inhibitor of DNA gyrase (YacG/DUF329 family)
MSYWKPGDIFELNCPFCDREIEFWKDDPVRFCPECQKAVKNPKFDPGCADWCEKSDQCLEKTK